MLKRFISSWNESLDEMAENGDESKLSIENYIGKLKIVTKMII